MAPVPIVQGGMGVGVSLSRLAASVANEGGIGVIASAGIGMNEPDFFTNYREANLRALRREIATARTLTKGILGINIMIALSNFAELAQTAMEAGIDIIFSGAGMPLSLPQYRPPNTKTKLVPIVSSGRAAALLCKHWLAKYDYIPDALVVEGPKAGGHLGFKKSQINDPDYKLENLVVDVIIEARKFESLYGKKIPVIAGGGIYNGADIKSFIDLGVDGVQMGTRFVATHECDADIEFKKQYIDARPEDIVIIDSPVGMPGRAIRNKYLDDVTSGIKKPIKCPYHCIKTCDFKCAPYCIANALISAQRGRLIHGFAFAGANAHLVTEIISIKELITSLITEYNNACQDVIKTS